MNPSTPAGVTGEVRLPAENGEPGEDMEEALVCPETGTDSVLQVPGETFLPQDCHLKDPTPSPGCVRQLEEGHHGPWAEGRGLAGGETL